MDTGGNAAAVNADGRTLDPTAIVPAAGSVTIADVSLEGLANEVVPRSAVTLPPLQAAGLLLAELLFAAIAVVIVAIFIVVFVGSPIGPPPVAPGAGGTPDQVAQYKSLIDGYKTLSDSQVSRATQLFQAVVGTALLPTFTAIVGYLFGRSNTSANTNS